MHLLLRELPVARSFPAPLRVAAVALILAAGAGCRPAALSTPAPEAGRLLPVLTLVPAAPADVGMSPTLARQLGSAARAAIRDSVAPGMAIAVGRYGRLVHLEGYGTLDWRPGSAEVTGNTLYDLASLTKVVATTTAAMILEEEGRLVLDSTVAYYLPDFAAADSLKRQITVRMLLTHTGGLEAGAALHRTTRGRAEYLEQIAERPLRAPPGTETVYSDWDLILLQLVIERVAGQTLDSFTTQRIFSPLGMDDTGFLPDGARRRRAAPSAVDTALRGGLLWGVVHDGNAWAIGGVSGHAGLFAPASDLAVFAQMLLNGGSYGGVRIVQPQTVARWTSPQGLGSSRALGWDTPSAPSSAGRYSSPRAFGHTGFTGTSLWVDPERGLFFVILANRVHSRGMSYGHTALRRVVSDIVHASILDAPLTTWEESPP